MPVFVCGLLSLEERRGWGGERRGCYWIVGTPELTSHYGRTLPPLFTPRSLASDPLDLPAHPRWHPTIPHVLAAASSAVARLHSVCSSDAVRLCNGGSVRTAARRRLQPGCCWREPTTSQRAASTATASTATVEEDLGGKHLSSSSPLSSSSSSCRPHQADERSNLIPPLRRKMGCWLSGVKGWNRGGCSSSAASEMMACPPCESIKFTRRFEAPLL